MTDYLTVMEVLAIHSDQIERYGGTHGLRDPGLLEAALYRLQTGYYKDHFAQGAALWESLSQNSPFIDGSKRTSFACAYTFLLINGLEIVAPASATMEFIINLYDTNSLTFEKLDPWLRENTEPVK